MTLPAGFETDIAHVVDPLVLAIDVGSTATRGGLYDATGRPAGQRAKVAHEFTTCVDGSPLTKPPASTALGMPASSSRFCCPW